MFKKSSETTPAMQRVSVQLSVLLDLARTASSLKQRRRIIKAQHSGAYAGNIKGRGMEFDETRLYQAGDDIRSIDWRVTARTGKPHTKLYREERERPVFLSIDQRSGMSFATRGVFKSVQAARMAALLAWQAEQQGDRVGGQLFDDKQCMELKPQNGRPAVLKLFDMLVHGWRGHQEEISLASCWARLNRHVRPGSIVYIISDFRGYDTLAEKQMLQLARHNQIVLVHIYDALESALPPQGRYRFTNKVQDVVVDTGNKQQIMHYQLRYQQHLGQLQGLARRNNIALLSCRTDQHPAQVLR